MSIKSFALLFAASDLKGKNGTAAPLGNTSDKELSGFHPVSQTDGGHIPPEDDC